MSTRPAPVDASCLVVRNAELDGALVDIAVDDGTITAITPAGTVDRPSAEHRVVDAGGGAVLPGLHDHHVHVLAMAAAAGSVPVGPADVRDAAGFAAAMVAADARLPAGRWIRAVGYHESVAGELDRYVLDQLGISRPVRVQHRTGALWVLNSAAIGALGIDGRESSVVETGEHGVPTGRLYRADAWLRDRIPRQPLDLAGVGHAMAAYGITGVTDLTPTSNPTELAVLSAALARGDLRCRLTVTGASSLPASAAPELPRGPVKLVIDDHQLPGLDWLLRQFTAARSLGRPVAVHCVTLQSLVLSLAAWGEVGALPGDRIEHGAVIPPELFGELAALGLTVVTQPSFVHERGDQYLTDVDELDRPHLWRCRSLAEAGVAVAFGSDAPYGSADPWAMLRAATERTTQSGAALGPAEALGGLEALRRLLGSSSAPHLPRRVEAGAAADLCVLDRPLAEQLRQPTADGVVATVVAGQVVHHRDDVVSG